MKVKGLAALMMAAATIALTSGVAHADPVPSGCSSKVVGGYMVEAKCKTGSGLVRAVAYCGPLKVQDLGYWVQVGQVSVAFCSSLSYVARHDYDVKSY